MPRIFSVLCKPISSNDEELANKDTEEVRNCSLLQEIERLKQQLESEKIFFMSRINYLKEVKQKQAKDIKELNTKITNLTSKLNELTKEKDAFYGDMNVIINNYNSLNSRPLYVILIIFLISLGTTKRNHTKFHL